MKTTNIMFYTVVLISSLTIASWIRNIHAAAPTTTTSGESYLYNTIDSPPVLDHGLHSNINFLSSTSPKVVEFYDPKCGACQAFKYNYIEVAKKVQQNKPNIEFYGVSCEVYQSICDKYGESRVPKIFVFPNGESDPADGLHVEKGSGTIYFLSARINKALRSPEEVALDAEKLSIGRGGSSSVEAPKVRNMLRRLKVMGDDDEDVGTEESLWGVNTSQEEDNNKEFSDLSGDEDVPADLERMIAWGEKRPDSEEDEPFEDASLDEKYMTEDESEDDGEEIPASKDEEAYDAASNNEDETEKDSDDNDQGDTNNNPQPSQQWHENTDAYKNTMKHFEALDEQHGKEKGHHFEKWKEEKAKERAVNIKAPRSGYAKSKLAWQEKEFHPSDGDLYLMNDGKPHSGPIPLPLSRRGNAKVWARKPGEAMPVGGDVSVPNPFHTDPVRANKFQEYVARKKQMMERKEMIKHPIDTLLGTGKQQKEEDIEMAYIQRKKQSPMNNYKAQYNPSGHKGKRPPDLRPEAQKKTVGEKILKKIPVVKRAFKRSKGEETLNDAALSFTRGLLMGVFKDNQPLSYKKKQALLDWFDLLRVSLPPEIGLHELIDTLIGDIESVSQRRENLLAIITKHPLPDSKWSYSCTKGTSSGGGFFCGFWKLLHVMSVGFAEQGGGLALQESSPSIRVFSAKEAGDVVREYMALFFNCEKCSKRFISQYDDCSFQRCNRLSEETMDAPIESWQEFPLWLWQVHNDISRSKSMRASDFHEKAGKRAEAKKWEHDMKAIYPHLDECISCVTLEGTWNLNAVYRHLEKEYWTFGLEVDPKMQKLLEHKDIERRNVSHGIGKYILMTLVLLMALAAKRLRIRASGRHKKIELSSVGGSFSKKYRDS